jgi:hypothetical protein
MFIVSVLVGLDLGEAGYVVWLMSEGRQDAAISNPYL